MKSTRVTTAQGLADFSGQTIAYSNNGRKWSYGILSVGPKRGSSFRITIDNEVNSAGVTSCVYWEFYSDDDTIEPIFIRKTNPNETRGMKFSYQF